MVNILVWNVNALIPTVKNFLLKHGSIKGFFDDLKADIICFQETKLMTEKLTEDLACVDGFESFWTFSQKKLGYSGVATFVRDKWSPTKVELDSLGDLDADLNGEGRIVITDHGSFVLLNVYVPNAGKKENEAISERADLKIRFLHALKEKCDSLREEGKKVILVGDMNVAASTKDCHPSIGWSRMYHKEELSIMHSILRQYTDMWRRQNPNSTNIYTVWDEKTFARSVNKGLRIDYVLVSPDVLPDVGAVQILDLPHKWSDHAALFVSIGNLEPPPPHEPVPESSKKMKQFTRQKQRSIATMFASRIASPKASKAAISELTPGQNADSAPEVSGQGDGVEASKSSSTISQVAEPLPEAKRQRLEASGKGGLTLREDKDGLGEAQDLSRECRADSSGPIGSSDLQNASQLPTKERKASASKAVNISVEQGKREAGQQGIKAFFAKSAQRRQKS